MSGRTAAVAVPPAARGWGRTAAWVDRETGADAAARIGRVFALACQRLPTAAEAEACRRLLESRGRAEVCRAILDVNAIVYGE